MTLASGFRADVVFIFSELLRSTRESIWEFSFIAIALLSASAADVVVFLCAA